jgi:hypothetical protein
MYDLLGGGFHGVFQPQGSWNPGSGILGGPPSPPIPTGGSKGGGLPSMSDSASSRSEADPRWDALECCLDNCSPPVA